MRDSYKQIKDDWQLAQILHQENEEIRHHVFQCVNLTAETEKALLHSYKECVFIGCQLPMGLKKKCKDCLFLPNMGETFGYRNHLYTPEELYDGYSPAEKGSYEKCFDGRVYRHFLKKGKFTSDAKETLARSLHDHSISDCLHDFLSNYNEHRLVGIMGGHNLSRTDQAYKQTVYLCKRLTEEGFLMISGGGPGAMEATHLGAWMAGRNEIELEDALHILSTAPKFTDEGWLETAWRIRERFPQKDFQSLGVPTWLYGHEPSTPLATHIAKYFDNSIREDGILTIAKGGIIYTPGSAGTLQEIFQEAVQNHYLTFGYASPMIFLGTDFWTKEVPVWPLIMDLTERGIYKNLILCLSDKAEDVERVLKEQVSAHLQ
jgi:predicted Rossmann-fold nucleotide-binding protein